MISFWKRLCAKFIYLGDYFPLIGDFFIYVPDNECVRTSTLYLFFNPIAVVSLLKYLKQFGAPLIRCLCPRTCLNFPILFLNKLSPECANSCNTVSIHCAPEMSEIDCIGRIESFWPKFVRGW